MAHVVAECVYGLWMKTLLRLFVLVLMRLHLHPEGSRWCTGWSWSRMIYFPGSGEARRDSIVTQRVWSTRSRPFG